MHTAERTIPPHLLAALYLPCSMCGCGATALHRLIEEDGGWTSICLRCDELRPARQRRIEEAPAAR